MITQSASAAGGSKTSYLNIVPDLTKVTIIPLREFSSIPVPLGPPYVAMFNPENWQVQHEVQYCPKDKQGNDGGESNFIKVVPATLSFDLVIDGTGASGEKREVFTDILLLKTTLLFNGLLHKPNLLLVIWSTQIFKGVLTSMNIKHTLFRSNGTPLRTTVSLSFKEQKSALGAILGMNLGSADLTHRRLVNSNDRLDLICSNIYEDSRYYIEVARANNLTSFRKLKEGSELVLPPLEKK
jgi:hypothetical protein